MIVSEMRVYFLKEMHRYDKKLNMEWRDEVDGIKVSGPIVKLHRGLLVCTYVGVAIYLRVSAN